MKKLFKKVASLLATLILFNFLSCDFFKRDNPVGPSGDGKIRFGDEVVLFNTVSSSGSTIVVNSNNSVLNGMKIEIPINCFSGTRKFVISSFEIKGHNFGKLLKPISPMVKIFSNGGYADGIFEVKVPIKIEKGSFPLVFIYDDKSEKLEPLPIQSFDENSVTFTTRHFNTSNLFPKNSTGKNPIIQSDEGYSLIFVSSMQESLINQTPTISSGFKPGIDDWEFPNYGSYIAPSGHCSGQNMAAFWYFYEKKLKGSPGLFNLMSKVNNIWQENNRGYRFCSVIHRDLSWEGTFINFFEKYIDKEQSLDKLKFYTIAGAMLITGEPQGIGIYRVTGQDNNGNLTYAGHDLICYQIEPINGKLYISDPNYPAESKFIYYKDGKFEPYQASLNASLPNNNYPFVTYYAKTAYIEWDKIATRWKEVEDYKIGNNRFPGYNIVSPDFGGFDIPEELNYDVDTLNIRVEAPGLEVGYKVNNIMYARITLFNEDGLKISNPHYNLKLFFPNPGTYTCGLLIEGFKSNYKDVDNNYIPKYVDFKWITINYSKYKVKIIPGSMKGEPNIEYTWNLDVTSIPKDLKYYIIWKFGDNNEARINNENFVKYKYSSPGTYKIKAELYDVNSNKLVGKDSATAEIIPSESIYPKFGPQGQTVRIAGKDYKNPNYSEINLTLHWDKDPTNHTYRALLTKVIDDNTLEAVVNDDNRYTIGKVYLKVRKYNSSQMKYEWEGPWEYEIVKLQVNEIKPDTIRTGSIVTIKGKNFGLYHPSDNVFMSLTQAKRILSWTNEEIVFEAPELSSSSNHYIYIGKSCYTNENNLFCVNHEIGQKYWEPLPSDVINLLAKASKEGEGFFQGNFNITITYYDSQGKVTGKSESEHQIFESLFNKETSNSFTASGENFEATVWKNPYGKLIYSGKVSKDGKLLENATIIRYDENSKVIFKVSFKNLPLIRIDKTEPRASWKYAVSSNATPYITEFYYAVYLKDGTLQYDAVMKDCRNISFDLNFYYKKE